jgi:hypothetical protein
MKILTLDGNGDELTQRSSEYRKKNVYDIHFAGHDVTHLGATQPPIRSLVSEEAKKAGLKFITGASHGSEGKSYTGNSAEVLYTVDGYEKEEVSGKIVHFLSCGVGGELGPNMVDKGCLAFFGYKDDFSLKGEAADIFLECDSAIDIGLLQGLTAGEVFDQVIALFNQRIAELRKSKKNYAAMWLRFNRDSLCAPSRNTDGNRPWGDVSARLS